MIELMRGWTYFLAPWPSFFSMRLMKRRKINSREDELAFSKLRQVEWHLKLLKREAVLEPLSLAFRSCFFCFLVFSSPFHLLACMPRSVAPAPCPPLNRRRWSLAHGHSWAPAGHSDAASERRLGRTAAPGPRLPPARVALPALVRLRLAAAAATATRLRGAIVRAEACGHHQRPGAPRPVRCDAPKRFSRCHPHPFEPSPLLTGLLWSL